MKLFDGERFLEGLIEDVCEQARIGKRFDADCKMLGPRLIALQTEFLRWKKEASSILKDTTEDSE